MKDRRQPHDRSDLLHGALVLEPQREQQAVWGRKLSQSLLKRAAQLPAADVGVGTPRPVDRQLVRIDLAPDEVLEQTARSLALLPRLVIAS